MVRIAIAGGSGKIARKIIEVLVATGKYEILILSRSEPPTDLSKSIAGTTWVKTDYSKGNLIDNLHGVHTVLSFLLILDDPAQVVAKTLIDAAVEAGVKRIAPSEWSSSSIEELPWYSPKVEIREYLAQINKEKKVIEYSLFQPGFLVDMLAPSDDPTAQELFIDLPNRRAIALSGPDNSKFTFTTFSDLANVVSLAISYPGTWPINGGVHGQTITASELLRMSEKARGGKPFAVTALKEEDVRVGKIESDWIPKFENPALTEEQRTHFSKVILRGCLLSGVAHSWVVGKEWNELLPEYTFEDAGESLLKAWDGKE